MSFSEFTQKDYEVIARDYADLKEAVIKRCANQDEIDTVQRAFEFANDAHRNVRRRSGEPYILHPIAVAKIVVNSIGLGCKSIAAALLHDVVEDTDYTIEDIERLFGDKIAGLVDGLTKIKSVLDNQGKSEKSKDEKYIQSLQAENFKRILLTLNDDVRVVLIKLADRLHNCRTIEYMPEYKRDKILSETMFIFVPLAHRLGLYEVKSEMENIWLRYKEPESYNDINAKLNRNIIDKEREIDAFIAPIKDALGKAGFNFEVRKRVKTPYSIWHKMLTKNVTFEQVYDLYAVRVIFTPDASNHESERDQCYHVFSIITGIYRYKADRIRDWVKHPKNNGYEALHCTLMSNSGIWVEVQIRTKRMDDIAEKGIAAHWAYKKDGYVSENDSEMDRWLSKVKEILVSPDVNALELLDMIHNDLIVGDIVVFTPKGEQKSVPKGSTVLDFAYQIHSHIGNKAIAAKVNMRLVPLSYVLKTGDSVEIISAEDSAPKREWLSFLTTIRARNLVMDYFRGDKKRLVAEGKASLEGRLDVMDVKYNAKMLNYVAVSLQLNNTEELFFRYSLGLVKLDDIVSVSKRYKVTSKKKEEVKGKEEFIIDSRTDGRRYVLATCCNPIAGDPVVGFVYPDGSVSVHKKSCNIAESLATKHGDWIVMPKWPENQSRSFPVRISIKGVDRVGLLNDITKLISVVMGVNMRKLSLGTDQGIFDGQIDLFVPSKAVLEDLISQIKEVDGIQTVMRTEV